MSQKRLRWIVAVLFVLALPGGITAQAREPAARQTQKPRAAPKKKRLRLPHVKMTERDWRRLKDTRAWVRDHSVTAAEITAIAVGVPLITYTYVSALRDGRATLELPEIDLHRRPR